MAAWREMARGMRRCARAATAFALLWDLLSFTCLLPLQAWCFRGAMAAAGCAYLTLENLGDFLRSPVTWLVLAGILLAAALGAVLEMAAYLTAFERGRRGMTTTLGGMAAAGFRAVRQVLRRGNRPAILLALLLTPLLNLGIAAGYFGTMALPQALWSLLLRRWVALLAAGAAAVLLTLLLIRYLYVLPCMLLEGCSFREARRRSTALNRGGRLRDLCSLLGLQLAAAALLLVLAAALIGALVLGMRWLLPAAAGDRAAVAVWVLLAVLLLGFTVVTAPTLVGWIGARYAVHRAACGEPDPRLPEDGPRLGYRRRAVTAVAVLFVLCAAVGLVRLVYDGAAFHLEYLSPMEVTAHRGASAQCPENTMPAFELAAEQGADWIELDVRQTRDGVLVVLHDESLLRTTGDPRMVWELDYAELAQLDAGSWFSPEFAGTPIPRLDEVLAFAADAGVRLNIELKPTGNEQALAEAAAAQVLEAGMEELCVMASPSYAVLEAVRTAAPELQTLYVLPVAFGNLLRLEAADAFSVRDVNVTSNLVSRLHNGQRTIWAWTVNSRSTVDKMYRLGVDNVITDNVPMAREQLYEGRTTDWLRAYIQYLEGPRTSAAAETGAD